MRQGVLGNGATNTVDTVELAVADIALSRAIARQRDKG